MSAVAGWGIYDKVITLANIDTRWEIWMLLFPRTKVIMVIIEGN